MANTPAGTIHGVDRGVGLFCLSGTGSYLETGFSSRRREMELMQ